MKQSTFGLRSSVFGLLIFLFSASQIQCANESKPAVKKQTSSRISPRMLTGLKYVGGTAVAALLFYAGYKINEQKNKLKSQQYKVDTYNVLHHGISNGNDNRYCLYPFTKEGLTIGYFEGGNRIENFKPLKKGDVIRFHNLPQIKVCSMTNCNHYGKTFVEYKFAPAS